MGFIYMVGCWFVFLWLCLPSPGHCQVNVQSVEIFPQQSVTNGTVTLTCRATSFDPDVYMFTWQHSVGSSYSEVMADDRISFGPANLVDERVKLYSQILTITNLTTSDAGSYLCVIKDNGSIIANGEGRLTVNSTEEFPVCFPDGLAVVNEGDILTCRTVIDDRTPVVSDTSSPIERSDWVKTLPSVNDSGSRLQKSVKISDDGVTFFCFSTKPENQNLTSLSCKIGPLTVIPDPLTTDTLTTPTSPQTVSTEEPGLSVGVITGMTICLILLAVLVTILVICFVNRRNRTNNTTSATGSNQQNPPHIYANAILEDRQASYTANAELHNYVNVNPSTSNHRGAHKDLSHRGPSSNTLSNQNDVTGQTDPYMELSPQEPKLDLYTELKL